MDESVPLSVIDMNECQFVLTLDKQGVISLQASVPQRAVAFALKKIAGDLERQADEMGLPPLPSPGFGRN